MGRPFSHAPATFNEAASSRAREMESGAFAIASRVSETLETITESHDFWHCDAKPSGGGSS